MTIAFIGGGNMAGALIGGLRQAGRSDRIVVVEVDAARRDVLRDTEGVEAFASIPGDIASASDIILAVKPADVRVVCESLRPHLACGTADTLLLSVAAGIPSASIAAWSGHGAVVRAMPNTPALIGRGMTGLFARQAVSAAQRERICSIIAVTGDYLWFEAEDQIDAVTAISGSGPAYVFLFLEALEHAAVHMGLDAEQGRRLAIQTFAGAAELAARSPEPLATLRDRVTSKGGTTAAALAVMGNRGLAQILADAALAARDRSRAMAREYAG